MNKFIKVLVILLIPSLLFVSCAEEMINETASTEKVAVKFIPNLRDSKAIGVDDTPEIAWLSYKASADFKHGSEEVSGETADWVTLTQKDNKNFYTTQKVFNPGSWSFEVQVGSGEKVYYSGSANVFLAEDDKEVKVDVLPYFDSEGEGSLVMDLSSSKLSDENGYFKVKLYDQSFTALAEGAGVKEDGEDSEISYNDYTIAASPNGQIVSTNEKTLKFVPGIYFAEIQYAVMKDQKELSTEKVIVAFKIIDGCSSTVSGSLDNGSYVQSKLGIQYFEGKVAETDTDNVFKFTKTNNCPGTVTYKWFLNGNEVGENSDTYTFEETTAGKYYLTCVAINSYNSIDDVVSSTITVNVK